MLRTIGRAIGMIKKQAQEFRNQFDEAIKDSEFEDLKESVSELKSEATSGLRELREGIDKEIKDAEEIGDDLNRDVAKSTQSDEPVVTSESDKDLTWLEDYERDAAAHNGQTPSDETDDPGAVAEEIAAAEPSGDDEPDKAKQPAGEKEARAAT